MNKIIEYMSYMSTNLTGFDEEINELIKEGWQPIGGICASVSPREKEWFYQAMVKYEEIN